MRTEGAEEVVSPISTRKYQNVSPYGVGLSRGPIYTEERFESGQNGVDSKIWIVTFLPIKYWTLYGCWIRIFEYVSLIFSSIWFHSLRISDWRGRIRALFKIRLKIMLLFCKWSWLSSEGFIIFFYIIPFMCSNREHATVLFGMWNFSWRGEGIVDISKIQCDRIQGGEVHKSYILVQLPNLSIFLLLGTYQWKDWT